MSPAPAGSFGAERSGAGGATPSGFIDRYQIVEKIGEGGMGSLFLAWDPAIDRLVAIKLLRTGFDDGDVRHRFALEARAAGRLRHPNIVTIFDVGERDGSPFIAMEFLPGETLHDLIRAKVRLTLPRRIKLLEELCDGLAYAHRAGMIHRDVKPANLMVDSDGVLKILDFGIARLDEGGVTQAGVLVGTLNYMAPEQVSGGTVGPHSDQFSVGLVAYELLTGKQAFSGSIQDGLLNRIATVGIEPLQTAMPDLDAQLVAIVERALELDPAARYPDLAAMRNELIAVRKRLETAEETSVYHLDSSSAETMMIPGRGAPTPLSGIPMDTLPIASDHARPAPPLPVIEDAERALNAGQYRTALSLAGRLAAAKPGDPTAAKIMVRAQGALLERGRALDTSGIRRVDTAQGKAGTATGRTNRRTMLFAAAGGLAVLVTALVWWTSQTPAPEPGGAAVPASPSITAGAPAATDVRPAPANPPTVPAPAPPDTTAQPPAPDAAAPVAAGRGEGVRGGRAPSSEPSAPVAAPVRPSAAEARTPSVRPDPATMKPAAPVVYVAGRDRVPIPMRIRYVEPVYPAAAAEARVGGTVEIQLTIGREGRVTDARITSSVPGLDQAALAAVRQWEFVPVQVNGAPVPVLHTVTVPFTPPPAKPVVELGPPPSRSDAPPVVPPKPPAAPAPEAKPAPKPPEKPAVDVAAEESAVRNVLRQFASAWESRDAEAVGRLQRLSPEALARVRGTLESAAEYRMTIDVQSVTVDPEGRAARAVATVSRRFRPRVGRTQNVPGTTTTFTLEKRDGRWIIAEVR